MAMQTSLVILVQTTPAKTSNSYGQLNQFTFNFTTKTLKFTFAFTTSICVTIKLILHS